MWASLRDFAARRKTEENLRPAMARSAWYQSSLAIPEHRQSHALFRPHFVPGFIYSKMVGGLDRASQWPSSTLTARSWRTGNGESFKPCETMLIDWKFRRVRDHLLVRSWQAQTRSSCPTTTGSLIAQPGDKNLHNWSYCKRDRGRSVPLPTTSGGAVYSVDSLSSSSSSSLARRLALKC